MRIRTYPIPKEITSEIKFTRHLYMIDVLIIGGFLIGGFWFDQYVYPPLSLIFILFMVFMGVAMVIRPHSNPQKRMYQVILLSILKDNSVVFSARQTEKEGDR